MSFILHPQLASDCYSTGHVDSSLLLLHKNALIPWFILVPDTKENELFKLDGVHQKHIQDETNRVAHFVSHYFNAHKLNIATIGNIVPQLHIHIIGRFTDDFCWPAPVWGQPDSAEYTPQALEDIKTELRGRNII
ncbi:MAG TPA: HIT domain-containing protein [Gammaproteobacteria bacterium]|nr:HIT domain-containing protein [Gammaproteobacteria bacterium]